MAQQIEITEVLDANDIEYRECDVCKKVFVRGEYYHMGDTVACSISCRDTHMDRICIDEVRGYILAGYESRFAYLRTWSKLHELNPDDFYYTALEA